MHADAELSRKLDMAVDQEIRTRGFGQFARCLGERTQTRGTIGLYYTLLGNDRFGAVDWR